MQADIIIRGGTLIDGTGAPGVKADLAIKNDRISAIGDLSQQVAHREINAVEQAVAPGFIDPHVHHDEVVLSDPGMAFMLNQGVTTIINGNCGFSIAPLTQTGPLPAPLSLILSRDPKAERFARFCDYEDRLSERGCSVNTACLIGHGTLRINEMQDLSRPADAAEIKAMCAALDQALDEGGLGLSTGPFYPPARAATTDELTRMARVAQRHGRLYVTHMRDEGDQGIEALQETLQIGRDAACGVHISHHKCAGFENHGQSVITLNLIEAARQVQDTGLDTTPWTASSTMLNSGRHRQASSVIIAESEPHPDLAGQRLDDVAKRWGVDLETAIERLLPAIGIFFIMDEADVQRILKYPHTIVCSDGIERGAHPHPRTWGTFPRVLSRYVRELGLLSLEDAVKRMTSMPADRFGLKDRGRLEKGRFADVVVFDPAEIAEGATYANPRQSAIGINAVIVNGQLSWLDNASTGARAGQPLRWESLQ